MAAPEDRSPAAVRLERAELWLDDLRWHKQMFQQSRFRWTGEHVLSIVTRYTGGQLNFTTVRHLGLLQRCQLELLGYSSQCRLAMAEPLRQAEDTLWGGWARTAEALGLSLVNCKEAVWAAVGTSPEERTNANVRGVLHRLPFSNPLIQAWELKQLCSMYEAAVDVFEDALCDLVVELSGRRPLETLVGVTDSMTVVGLQARITAAREARGEPDDPRRVPAQVF